MIRTLKDGRVILSGADYSALRFAVFQRDHHICQICFQRVCWDDYEMDHYRDKQGNPIQSRGGGKRHDSLETCRTSHRWCNRNRVRPQWSKKPLDNHSTTC